MILSMAAWRYDTHLMDCSSVRSAANLGQIGDIAIPTNNSDQQAHLGFDSQGQRGDGARRLYRSRGRTGPCSPSLGRRKDD